MKKLILATYMISILTPVYAKAGAMDMINLPLTYLENYQTTMEKVESLNVQELQGENLGKLGDVAESVQSGSFTNVSSLKDGVFKKKDESAFVSKEESEIIDDEEALSELAIEENSIEVNNDTGDMTLAIKEKQKNQADKRKGDVFKAYAEAIGNRAAIAEVREKLNDIQEDLYSSEDNMGTYNMIPEISNLVSVELQQILLLETLNTRLSTRSKLMALPEGFKPYEVSKDKKEGEE